LAPLQEKSCPCCGARTHEPLESIDLEEQHRNYAAADPDLRRLLATEARRTAVGYAMWRCAACGLEWADPMAAPPGDWYRLLYSTHDLYPGVRWEFQRVLASSSRADSLFDIGCGSGAFLRMCADAGIACQGADFSPHPVQACREQGLRASCLNLDQDLGQLTPGQASVVTAFQVLEHLSKPHRLFEFARVISGESARLWVAVPSERRPSRVFGERDCLDQPPHHLTRWSQRSLAALAAGHGWKLAALHFEPLGLLTALWTISTRSAFYRRSVGRASAAHRSRERFTRLAHAPAALLLRGLAYRSMSGFSMLGEFRKDAA
jgi:SAM-dependent methyltransferase